MSLSSNGDTLYVSNMGASIAENPAGIIYSTVTDKLHLFLNTNSIAYKNQGGLDWMYF
jgi:hypothetical protein